ncbi:uncharacterized protein [Gossypium hirsutum]|uniref:Uncharacterized protein isoform X3 n=1 Tax=Gossypium hirsutum TaxID=3635 RepID=A0ABM3C0F5_GOSHI|nr:uncharacterized protein LOC121231872 isoform X3 [Gossypium hirsutum]
MGFFHMYPKCKKIHLTNFSFANHLLVFVKGFVDFIFAIKESISGLQMNNNSKSELFNSGTSDSTLLAVADFTVPIRFFGVLLVTRSPKAVDCKKGTDGTAKDAKNKLGECLSKDLVSTHE